jgi:hypothetical protein
MPHASGHASGQVSDRLTLVVDPGHAWLRVPLVEIARLGIEDQISAYSYINGNYAYLEEDSDAGRYQAARQAQGHPPPTIHIQHVACFNHKQTPFDNGRFPPEFWDKLRSK